jgi:hypothetical protein
MLLNELQKQIRLNQIQTHQIRNLSAQLAGDKVRRNAFEKRLSTLEQALRARNLNPNLAARPPSTVND